MDKRKVHVRDADGNPRYNRLLDDGADVFLFASGSGFVTRYDCNRKHWQICDGWISDQEWNDYRKSQSP